MISPINHFVFTPLLPQTAVGTLEFRAIQEPVRTLAGLNYTQAKALNIDFAKKVIQCKASYTTEGLPEDSESTLTRQFEVSYDKLVIAVGTKTNTFNIPGIEEREGKNVFFFKQLLHARQVRNKIIDCFERASLPGTSEEERRILLNFVVVGGGPTSIELAAELHDFVQQDIKRWYADLLPFTKVTVIEATNHILGAFDAITH